MKRIASFKVLCLVGLSMLIGGGCSSSTPVTDSHEDHASDHDHASHVAFASYVEAVTKLESLARQIGEAFTAKDPDKAHDPVHDVGHVLEQIPELARKEQFSEEQQEEIKKAVETLFESFHEIDKTFHGGEGKTYDQVADNVNAALKRLTDAARSGEAN